MMIPVAAVKALVVIIPISVANNSKAEMDLVHGIQAEGVRTRVKVNFLKNISKRNYI